MDGRVTLFYQRLGSAYVPVALVQGTPLDWIAHSPDRTSCNRTHYKLQRCTQLCCRRYSDSQGSVVEDWGQMDPELRRLLLAVYLSKINIELQNWFE